MSVRGAAKAFQILAFLAAFIFFLDNAAGANDPYPSLGEFVDALSRELAWPAGSTTEENILELRTEKVIPSYLTKNHPATPTVVMAVVGGFLQRSRAVGDDPKMVLSALVRAAVASGAPMPTFPPDEIPNRVNLVILPPIQPEIEVPPPYPLYAHYPLSAVIVHKGFRGRRFRRKETVKHVREFPHTIFRRGESPAEKGPGVFPRR